MTNDDTNSSGSYVLNSMDENERHDFETRMAGSEQLRNEVTELTDTAVLLGMAVDPVTPSPALKQNIMARLSQTPQLEGEDVPPVRSLRAVPSVPLEPVAAQPLAAVPLKAQLRWYRRPVFGIVAAAAAVVLIAGGVIGTNVAIQGAQSSQQTSAFASIEMASDSQRAQVSVTTGGTATLVWSLHLHKSALIGKDLKPLPAGKTYQLWYMRTGSAPIPAGLFESNGKSTLQVLGGLMSKGDTVGVTVEPAGGSKAPTTEPVVAIASA